MNFLMPKELSEERTRLDEFLEKEVQPELSGWCKEGTIPRSFFRAMAKRGWFGFFIENGSLERRSAFREAMVMEKLAALSPGVAVSVLAHVDLGITGLWLFGSDKLMKEYGGAAMRGDTILCLGNTERDAGSDAANLSTTAKKVDGGWRINGSKAYVTNGTIADMAIITAVSDPSAPRNRGLSMFLVDLATAGVTRKKLNKQVWIPSDLTRLHFNDVFIPQDHLLGVQGRGFPQVLTIFTYSRVPISALALGTAKGAFDLAWEHGHRRKAFGKNLLDFQVKQFEVADLYARMEAARLMVWKACWKMDHKDDFRLDASLAKYLTVSATRDVTQWAADLFGAASVILEHPIHKYPMDAWAASLGEGTQDIQKLVVFRELMKHMQAGR